MSKDIQKDDWLKPLKDRMAFTKGLQYYIEHPEELYRESSDQSLETLNEILTEDAEFEIIEPKQLPEPK